MKSLTLLIFLFVISTAIAQAEIEKIARTNQQGVSLNWWPKIAIPEGWHQDQQQSIHYNANALAPDGFTFQNADAVIYASALYKPRSPEINSVATLIKKDKADFLQDDHSLQILDAGTITTADGIKLISVDFIPRASGNLERVSYGEEDDYFLVFTLSARSTTSFNSALVVYNKITSTYKKKR